MLFIIFQIGQARYALDTDAVVEIVPRVTLKPVLRAPPGVAGLLDYHAVPVPVLDLCEMATGQPAQTRFSTRLILLRAPRSDDDGGLEIVGLLAERATSLLKRQPADFTSSGLHVADAPFLGPVTTDSEGFIHRVNVAELLTGAVRELFAPSEAPLA
jgi:chemotaxis-related protein WspB